MIEIYSTHKTISIGKIAIFITAILLIILICYLLFSYNNTGNSEDSSYVESSNTFIDSTNTIQMHLSSNYNLKEDNPDSNYTLKLQSQDNLYIFASCKNAVSEKHISEIISKDREKYILNYSNVSNLTEVKFENINNIDFYSYKFQYTENSSSDYVFESIWIEKNSIFYIIDIVFPESKTEKYINLHSDIINSLEILN